MSVGLGRRTERCSRVVLSSLHALSRTERRHLVSSGWGSLEILQETNGEGSNGSLRVLWGFLGKGVRYRRLVADQVSMTKKELGEPESEAIKKGFTPEGIVLRQPRPRVNSEWGLSSTLEVQDARTLPALWKDASFIFLPLSRLFP